MISTKIAMLIVLLCLVTVIVTLTHTQQSSTAEPENRRYLYIPNICEFDSIWNNEIITMPLTSATVSAKWRRKKNKIEMGCSLIYTALV